jgi:hypothetical protein
MAMGVRHLSFVGQLVRIDLLSTMTRGLTFVGRCDNALAEPHRWWEGPNYEGQSHNNGGCYSVRSYRRSPVVEDQFCTTPERARACTSAEPRLNNDDFESGDTRRAV